MIRLGSENRENARQLWMMCARDMLFYINTFVWTHSSKDHADCPERPMITWDFQDEAMLKIESAIGKHDLLTEKSRDMGASWMHLIVLEWRWHFRRMQTFLLVSRVEDLVDKKNDPGCLMWKIDFIHKNQPRWLLPNITRQKLSIYNEDMDGAIVGSSTTGEASRGARPSAILLDEFAAVEDGYGMLSSSRDATNCRLFNSTPRGTANAFYDVRSKINPTRRLRLHWTAHPLKSAGLYIGPDGKARSPWYDEQCDRAANLQEIAQELDIDYAGSGWQYFDDAVLAKLIKEHCRPPYLRGELAYEQTTLAPSWTEQHKGRWKLWTHVDPQGSVPSDQDYVVACDIASGKGGEMSSNSAISIASRKTGEKVAEFTSPSVGPADFALLAVAACKWFKGPSGDGFLIWEENGPPGASFGKAVIESGFRRFFYRSDEQGVTKKRTNKPGWNSSKTTKPILLSTYAQALMTGKFINRSEAAMKECGEYVHAPNGTIEHSRARAGNDPTATGESHGDIVIADALANRALTEMPHRDTETIKPEAPEGSIGHRIMEFEREEANELVEAW